MTYWCIAAVLSTFIVTSTFNIAQARSSIPLAKVDIINEPNDKADIFIENFSKWIEKFKNGMDKYSSLHQDNYYNKNLSQKVKEFIEDHIKKTFEKHIKYKTDELSNSVMFLASANKERSNPYLTKISDHHADKKNSIKQSNGTDCHESKESSPKDEARYISQNGENWSKRKMNELMHDISDSSKDFKTKIKETVIGRKKMVKNQMSKRFDNLTDVTQNSASTSENNNDSNDVFSTEHDDSSSSSAETVSKDMNEINEIINDNIYGNAEKQKATETYVHQAFKNRISGYFRPNIKNLHLSKQAFLNAVVNRIKVANELYVPSGTDGRSEDRSFDFQSLMKFKSKLRDMILKKKLYIKQKAPIKTMFKDTLNDSIVTYNNSTLSSSTHSMAMEEVNTGGDNRSTRAYGHTTEHIVISSNIIANISVRNGLKLAAGYTATKIEDNDEENSTAVVLVVLACLAFSAAVVVVVLVLWKKHHRHSLYVRIPSGYDSCPGQQTGYNI